MKCPLKDCCCVCVYSPEYCFEQNCRDWEACPIFSKAKHNIIKTFDVKLEKRKDNVFQSNVDLMSDCD